MDYRVREVIATMQMLERAARKVQLPTLDKEAVRQGLHNSRNVCTQPVEVVATPIMKDLMTSLGDIKLVQGADGEVHHTRFKTGEQSKAVAWMNKVVNAARGKFNGVEQHDYPESIPVDSKRLYDIDCWNGWKEDIWDIMPGQEDQLRMGFNTYKNPKTNMSVGEVITLLQREPAYQVATLALLHDLPVTTASREIRKINDPFMSKGTGVSYPDYFNDRTLRKDGRTYAQYEIDLAEKAASNGIVGLRKFAYDNNVCTGYARFQRGSGRPLIAQSRRCNLVINCVNGPEMELWKDSEALRAAFVDEEQLLAYLSKLGDWVLARDYADAANLDYSKWDRNLGAGWIAYQDAVRYLKAADKFTRELILIRYVCNAKSYLVDGLSNSVSPIYGRMTSGYLDTTLGNSTCNRGMSRGTACLLDRNHIRDFTKPLNGCDLTVVGDDLLLIARKGFISKFAKLSNAKTKTVMHEDEKHARGIMFIQYRAFRVNGKWVMAYNWPRVLRSMLSKENAKQLGRGGWTFAFYQQLGKLLMYDEACMIALNIAAAIDRYHLSLDIPVADLMKMVQDEDANRIKVGSRNRSNKIAKKNTTAEQLYNSNPNIPGVKEENGRLVLDTGYFERVQRKLKSLYDPHFLPNQLGIENPDLRKVSPSV